MASLLGSESHKYIFNESALPILDQVGSNDSDGFSGDPSFTGNSMITDGVDDAPKWSTVKQPVLATADHTQWIVFRYLDTVAGAESKVFLGPNPNGFGPNLFWQDSVGLLKTFGFDVNNKEGTRVDMAMPRLINNNEIIFAGYSYNATTRLITAVIKSNQGLNENGTVTEGTGVVSLGAVLGANGPASVFTNLEYFEYGTINGTDAPLLDIQDTGNILLARFQTIRRRMLLGLV